MKNQSLLFVLGVMFPLICFLPSCLVSPVYAAANVILSSHTGYMHWGGSYMVVGEVQNVGDTAAKDVYVSITYYDAGNAVIDSIDVDVLLDVVLSGRKAPFKHVLGAEDSARVDHYAIEVHFTEYPTGKPQGLEILWHNSTVPPVPPGVPKWLIISGEIKNVGSETATVVFVTSTHYDALGKVIGVSLVGASPPTLQPNQVATFQILEEITYREALYHTYELSAESPEYALIPEFPALIVLSLFIVVTLVAVGLNRLKHKRSAEMAD